ncbi:type II secretion system protein GspC [Ferrimonas marina]|uniref:Type II secretion system protein C (GspC) n=1 Tax=Ferrimonas marina TaxID=299255 RepID=A0A1M5Z8W9_9GAMM|nr:type II secretion system protein GspC [Ferrimonas marina]SHI20675.1 type II secretion system protein C (GspC) [Ferrimonas marina]
MDLSQTAQQALARIPQPLVARVLTVLLVLCALYLAALITWQLLPNPSSDATPWQPQARQGGQSQSVSIDPVVQLSLFGTAAPQDEREQQVAQPQRDLITDAPKTTLRILLTGLVASSVEERGIAIIESSGAQETYGIGDKITGTNASLHEVYADRAIILNQGNYETLMLDGVEYTREMSNETQRLRQPPTQARSEEASAAVAEARQALLEDPGSIVDYISISPVRKDGGLAGYRLNPGRKGRELFVGSGLKPNDLAVAINGYDLTNLAEAAQVMTELQELTEASVTVERDGQLTQVQFSLPNQ